MKQRYAVLFVAVLLFLLMFGTVVLAADSEQRAQFVPPRLIVNTSFLNVRTGPGLQYSVLVTVVGGTEFPVLGVARGLTWYQVSTLAGVGWINVEYAIPRGDFSHVPLVEAPELDPLLLTEADLATAGIAATGTNRVSGLPWGISVIDTHPARPEPTGLVSGIGIASANTDVIYPLLGSTSSEGITWYRINLPDTGPVWVEGPKSLVRPFACELSAVVMLTHVTLRRGPDGTGPAGDQVGAAEGSEAYLLAHQGDQYKVALIDGTVGWIPANAAAVREDVRSEFCERAGDLSALGAGGGGFPTVGISPAHVVVNTGFLNVRTGPGAGFAVVATLRGGDEVSVLAIASDGVWYLVEGDFGRGWLNNEFVIFRGDGRNLPIIPIQQARELAESITTQELADVTIQPEDTTAARLATARVVVNTGALNIRSGPGPQYTVVITVRGGTELPVLGIAPDGVWFLVDTSAGEGWLNNQYAIFRGDINSVPVITDFIGAVEFAAPTATITDAVTLYPAPNTSLGSVGALSGPLDVPIVARTADFTWVQLSTPLGFGWVRADRVTIRGDTTTIPVVSN